MIIETSGHRDEVSVLRPKPFRVAVSLTTEWA